VLEGEVT